MTNEKMLTMSRSELESQFIVDFFSEVNLTIEQGFEDKLID